jgi:transposase
MIDINSIDNIYVVTGKTDLRKGIDGYAHIIQDSMKLDPFSKSIFIFCNRQHNKIKVLTYENNGFWLMYKRLDKSTFKWISDSENGSISITKKQLVWLLEGLDMNQKRAFKDSKTKYI